MSGNNFLKESAQEKLDIQFNDMTGNEISDVTSTKGDLFKRLDKRKENLEQQRSANLAERAKNAAENQSLIDKLNNWSNSILTKIETSNINGTTRQSDEEASTSCEYNTALLNSLSDEIQNFDIFFKEKIPDLSNYDVRHTQEVTVEIKEKFVALQDKLKPKKKFGFKSKYKKNLTNKSDETGKAANINTQDKLPGSLDVTSAADTGSYKVTNPNCDSVIEVPRDDIAGRDVELDGLGSENASEKLIVKILGSPGTLHATNLINVTLLCGPVRTSVFVENCINCDFVVACQQLRTHSTKQSNIYLHVTAKGIVEDCQSVGFAPYNLFYPNLNEDFSVSKLNREVNNWSQIDDFNWLVKERPSPNWHILPEIQRKENWLS